MSSAADLISLISSAYVQSHFLLPGNKARIGLGSVALPAYDYLITLDQEVRLVWMRKKTAATWLFLVIRYHALVAMVFLQAISSMPMSDNLYATLATPFATPTKIDTIPPLRCSTYVKVQAAVQFAQYVTWAAFSALRALALSGMNWLAAAVVFILACGPFAVNMWQITAVGVVGFNIPEVGCIGSSNITAAEAKIGEHFSTASSVTGSQLRMPEFSGTAVSRSCIIAADLMVIAISWWYAAKDWTIRDIRSPTMSLTLVMVLNGTTYFLALTLLNILHLTLTLLSLVGVADQISPVTIFVDPLTAILICRFLLDLHSANVKSTHEISGEHHFGWEAGSLHFASFVVSMGGTVGSSTLSTEPDSITLKDYELGATAGDSLETGAEPPSPRE
ncbi:hypothetical protein ACG7TL_004795 [Trametes sanguinea]